MKKLLLILGVLCGIAFSAVPVAPFANGERVVFLGASTTRNGGYIFDLQLFEDLRHPGSGTVMMNAGIGSETAGDACRRYEHDVLKRNPDRVFVMFGLNDLGLENYATATPTKEQEDKRQASLKNYRLNYKRLIDMILGSGKKLVVMTTNPYDQYSTKATATNRIQGNDPGMTRMAQEVRQLANENNLGLVEIHAPFTEMLKAHPEMELCNKDRVHPTSLGHLYMAALILEAMGEDGLVAEVELDVTGKTAANKDTIVAKATNATVSNINVRGNFGKGFAFRYTPKALPYPCMPDYKTLEKIYPITEKLNREILRIKGLPAGNYLLKANGVEIASASSEELAKGINIATLNTPSQKNAMKAGHIMRNLRNFSEKMRLMAYIDSLTLKRNGNPDNYEESIQVLEKWASNLPDKKYMQRVETYKQMHAQLAQKNQEEQDWRRKQAGFKPEPFVISVEANANANANAIANDVEPIQAVEGVRGKAAHIKGHITYLADPERSDFDIEKGVTASMWIRAEKWDHQSSILGNIGELNILKRGIGNGGFYFWAWDGWHNDASILWSADAFQTPMNKWFHLALTYDQNGHSVGYINGKKVAEQLPEQVTKQGRPIVKIISKSRYKARCFSICNGAFVGDIDEVYVYGRALSETEIAELADGKAPAGALAAWLMDDATNIGKDSSGNNRNLKQMQGILGAKVPILGYELDVPAAAAGNGVVAYCRSCVDRVFQKDRLKSVKIQDAPVAELAGNEFETFQLVILPEKQLNKVNISLPPFEYKGVKVPAELRMVEYVRIPTPSNIKTPKKGANVFGEMVSVYPGPDATPGMYPDPLPRMENDLTLKAGESRGFWVTVKSPKDAPAGIYRSKAILSDANGKVLEVPLSIKVRGFSLSDERHATHITSLSVAAIDSPDMDKFYKIMSDFYMSPSGGKASVKVTFDGKGNVHLDTKEWDAEMEIAVGKYNQQVLFLSPFGLYGIPKANDTRSRRFGVQISQGDGHLTPEFVDRFSKFLAAMGAHVKEKGYLDRTRMILVDEPHTPADFSICWEVSNLIRKHAPGLKIFLTKWPTKESIGCADIWCLGAWQPGQIEAARKRGEKVENYPNWHMLIDRPVMDRRMLGFTMWKYGVSGITHWALDKGWRSVSELMSPALRYPNGRIIYGSGLVMYPEKDRLPMPSMRLETIRDALDDYEYLYMLDALATKHAGKPEGIEAKQFIKDACAKIVPCYESLGDDLKAGWKELKWELDPYVLLKYRRGVMDRIEKLQALK